MITRSARGPSGTELFHSSLRASPAALELQENRAQDFGPLQTQVHQVTIYAAKYTGDLGWYKNHNPAKIQWVFLLAIYTFSDILVISG